MLEDRITLRKSPFYLHASLIAYTCVETIIFPGSIFYIYSPTYLRARLYSSLRIFPSQDLT